MNTKLTRLELRALAKKLEVIEGHLRAIRGNKVRVSAAEHWELLIQKHALDHQLKQSRKDDSLEPQT